MANLAPHRSQCYVQLKIDNLAAHDWAMKDLLGQEQYQRAGTELQASGLYLDLPAYGAQLLDFRPVAAQPSPSAPRGSHP